MNKNTFSLSFSQFVLLIYKTQIGIGVLTLPRELFKAGNYDSWLAIFIGWLSSIVVCLFIIRTLEKHPNQSLFELLPHLFGKWIGNFLLATWVVYALLNCSFVFMYTVILIKIWILPFTNAAYIGLLLTLPVYCITKSKLQLISRYAEFTFIITFWMYAVIILGINEVVWENLFPIFRDGWRPVIESTPATVLSFLGFEQLFLLYPLLKNKQKAVKGVIIANSMTAIILLIVTIAAFIRMSELELSNTLWPTLNALKLIRFPFLERFEVIFISAYVIVLLMSVIPYLHMTLTGTAQLFNRSKLSQPLMITILLTWVVLLYSPYINHATILEAKKCFVYIGTFFAFAFPILLWLYNKAFLALQGRKKLG
jgi:spore germination protein (amino acid permease)